MKHLDSGIDKGQASISPENVKHKQNKYTESDFLNEVFMTEKDFVHLSALLRKKKNIVLQGPPGVGKTFSAHRLAYAMMGEKDDDRIGFVQFHENYAYEDFVLGYKPVEYGFELQKGVFYLFCDRARQDPEHDYFFIIDEINRGNLSKILGELMTLIEKDYRQTELILSYGDESFSVPENIYLIGMMNTADRSLAFIDYALRRRFSFYTMKPGFDSQGFKSYMKASNSKSLHALVEVVTALNRYITEDPTLGRGYVIGHSYFCGLKSITTQRLRNIVDYDLLPILQEYWFDDPESYNKWKIELEKVFHGTAQ